MRKLFHNIGSLVTLAPLVQRGILQTANVLELGIVSNAWLLVEHGKIHSFGSGMQPSAEHREDLRQGLVMPGFVDSHTHLLYAGSRADEFSAKLNGASYQDIAAQGGGILSTVSATRAASDDELLNLMEARVATAASFGITTLEVKTGYGLTVAEELRHLRLYAELQTRVKQQLYVTCLALHAVPPEFSSARAWADVCRKELLPEVAKSKLAQAVDAFIEHGYFAVADVQDYLDAASGLGLDIRLHADEFSESQGAAAAARWNARSADHLQFASVEGIGALATSGTIATLLPGTSLCSKIAFADAKKFLTAGCLVALATDLNPGSCPVPNLSLVASIGAVHCGLSLPQVVTAITRVPAHGLGFASHKGTLAEGFDADFSVWSTQSVAEWAFAFGQHKPKSVYIGGDLVASN